MSQGGSVVSANPTLVMTGDRLRYSRRQGINHLATVVITILAFLSIAPLVWIIVFVASRGISAFFPTVNGVLHFNGNFFTQDATVPIDAGGGGIIHAILGTMEMLIVAAILAVPVGIGIAIYVVEFGSGLFASSVRFLLSLLAGVPSIVVGIFIAAILVNNGPIGHFSGLAGAVALAVIMLPVVAASVEEILRLVPNDLREAGLALGTPRWRVILRVVIPRVQSGILTSVVLAMARAAGETAPLLMTALGNTRISFDLFQPMSSITLQMFADTSSAYEALRNKAFASAIILILVVAVFSAAIRIVTRRVRYDV